MLLFVCKSDNFVYIWMACVERRDACIEHEMDFDARETLFEAPAQRRGEHGVADAAETDD